MLSISASSLLPYIYNLRVLFVELEKIAMLYFVYTKFKKYRFLSIFAKAFSKRIKQKNE